MLLQTIVRLAAEVLPNLDLPNTGQLPPLFLVDIVTMKSIFESILAFLYLKLTADKFLCTGNLPGEHAFTSSSGIEKKLYYCLSKLAESKAECQYFVTWEETDIGLAKAQAWLETNGTDTDHVCIEYKTGSEERATIMRSKIMVAKQMLYVMTLSNPLLPD